MFSVTLLFTIGKTILLENRDPAKTMVWILLCIFLPPVALFLYFVLGQGYTRKKVFLRADLKRILHKRDLKEKHTTTTLTHYNEIEIYKDGLEAFPKIFSAMREAKHHIHIEFYILRDDSLGKGLQEILLEKARQGIQIRILYDAMGSYQLSKEYMRKLQREGIEIRPFFSLGTSMMHGVVNYRNHRKIIVIDGKVGFTGGLNIGKEYIGEDPKLGYWRDTHMRLKGESIQSLQGTFLLDWICSGAKSFEDEVFFPPSGIQEENKVKIIHSGPDSKWKSILQNYFITITQAQKSILIETPYFIPDESILMALRTAALRGIEVKIILPYKQKMDSLLCWYANFSYVEDLLEAGVKIYEYSKGFMHAKVCIVDQNVAIVGSSNIDMRSFFLDFEANAVLYDQKSIETLMGHFEEDVQDSIEVDFTVFLRRKKKERYKESLARLFSPLL